MSDLSKPAANGIDAELTIGTKEEQINTEVVLGDKHKVVNQTAGTIENANVTLPMLGLLVLLAAVGMAGWMAPVPKWLGGKDE